MTLRELRDKAEQLMKRDPENGNLEVFVGTSRLTNSENDPDFKGFEYEYETFEPWVMIIASAVIEGREKSVSIVTKIKPKREESDNE